MYTPTTPRGAGLVAHELAHIVQQRQLARPSVVPDIGAFDDTYEREADEQVAVLVRGEKLHAIAPITSPRIQRSFLSSLLDVVLFVPRLFGLEVFPAEDLREYLRVIRQKR
jgi:hypothetical protein